MTIYRFAGVFGETLGSVAVAVCLFSFINMYISMSRRKKALSVITLFLPTLSMLYAELMEEADHPFVSGALLKPISFIGSLPTPVIVSFPVILLIVNIIIARINRIQRKQKVNITSIREYCDIIPAGICCYNDNGTVVFQNQKMKELCFELTGGPLLNGLTFYRCLADPIVKLRDGSVWQFSHSRFLAGKEDFNELIASDITELYGKTEALKNDTIRAEKLSRELSDYNRNIDATVRKNEILQAKIRVHDEMNKLMLMATAAIGENVPDERKHSILLQWKQLFYILKSESEQEQKNDFAEATEIAGLLGVSFTVNHPLPEITDDSKYIIRLCARESIANAVKHACAEKVEITITKKDGIVTAVFENDGNMPVSPVNGSGGLLNIKRMLEKRDGNLLFEWDERFRMIVNFKDE